MADHARVETADEPGDDLAEHEHTYRFFIKMVKWNVAVIVVILAGMAFFLT
ncbi:MAG TPA: aa3-type cytochrome c oxidase subunit IV [Xanthobacteraceae bacterium]